MAACPNKNNPEWINLVKTVGEEKAYLLYVLNNEDIPVRSGNDYEDLKSNFGDLADKVWYEKELVSLSQAASSSTLAVVQPGTIENFQFISKYYTPKLSLKKLTDIVNDLVYQINTNILNEGKQSVSSILTAQKERFNDIKNKSSKPELIAELDKVLSSWDVISNLVKLKLASMAGIGVSITTDDNTDDTNDDLGSGSEGQEEVTENRQFDSDWSIRVNLKNTMSARLKRFMSTIVETKEDGTPKKGYLNTVNPISFDTVYDKVIPLLSGVPSNLNAVINVLNNNLEVYPWLSNLVEKLKNAPDTIQNEFMVNANNHYVAMQYLGYSKDEDGYTMVPTNTNSNDVAKTIARRWINSLVGSELISNDDYNYDIEVVKKVIKTIKDAANDKTNNSLNIINGGLELLGIKLSPLTLQQLYKETLRHGGVKLSYRDLFKNNNGVFKVLEKRLDYIVQNPDKTLLDYNILEDNAIESLAKFEAKYNSGETSNSHTRSDNKTIYSFSRTKFFVDRLQELTIDKSLLNNLSKISFTKNSTWLKKLIEGDPEFISNFKYSYVDSLVKFGASRPDILAKGTPSDHEVFKLGMFQNRGTKTTKGVRYGNILYPTMSDGTTMFMIHTELHNTSYNNDGIYGGTLDELYNNLILPELTRIENRKENTGIDGYDKGSSMFLMLPQINEIYNETLRNISPLEDNYQSAKEEFVKKSYDKIKQIVDKAIEDKINYWIEIGILKPKDDKTSNVPTIFLNNTTYQLHFTDKGYLNNITSGLRDINKVKYSAADFVVNYLLGKANIQQLFIGDPALYYKDKGAKNEFDIHNLTYDNINKRLAFDRAPGAKIADYDTDEFDLIVTEDFKQTSSKQEYLDKLGIDYGKINSTDAQELTSFREHVHVMHKQGKISKEYKDKLIRLEKDGNLSVSDLEVVFQPIKPVYSDHIIDLDNDIDRRVYVKSSSFPLIRQITQGLAIDKLRKQIEDYEEKTKRNVRLAFISAVKVGGFSSPLRLFTPSGTIIDNLDFDSNKITLSRKGFKIQQEVPYHDDSHENEVNLVSQASVLLFNNILEEQITINGKTKSGKEWQQDYFDLFQKLYLENHKKLREEITINGKLNIDKLYDVITKEIEKRGFDFNSIEGLATENGQFVNRITFHNNIYKYESLLMSIVDNRVRKLKMPGTSFVLGSEAGWKMIDDSAIGNVNGIVWIRKAESLAFNEILIPCKIKGRDGQFIDLTEKNNEGRFIWLTEEGLLDTTKFDSELLNIAGFRIPNQGHNSMASLKVAGFLPKYVGDLCIATRDLVAQMGSDFDIDKLYTYLYNYEFKYNENYDKEKIRDLEAQLTNVLHGKKYKDLVSQFDKLKSEERIGKELLNAATDEEERRRFLTEVRKINEELNEFYEKLEDAKPILDQLKELKKYDPRVTKLNDDSYEGTQNKIIDFYHDILGSKNRKVETQNFTSVDSDIVKDIANELYNARQNRSKIEGDNLYTSMLETYDTKSFFDNRDGKTGVASFSALSVFNANLQGKNIAHGINMVTEEGSYFIETQIRFGNAISNSITDPTIYGEDSITKADIISWDQTESVDNAKNKNLYKLNITADTINAKMALTMLGFGKEGYYFLNQDAVFDIVSELNKLRGATSTEYGKPLDLAAKKVRDKYRANIELSEEELGTKLESLDKELSGDKMFEMIEKGSSVENYNLYQYFIVDRFLHLDQIGNDIRSLISTINTNSKGVGNSYFEIGIKSDRIKNLYDNSKFINADQLIGEYINLNGIDVTSKEDRFDYNNNNLDSDTYFAIGDIGIKPKTINGHASVYATLTANELYKELFKDYNDVFFNGIVDKLNSILKVDITKGSKSLAKTKQEIFNDVKSYFYNSLYTNVNETRRNLLYDTWNGKKQTNESLATKIQKIQNTRLGTNNFINKLSLDIKRDNKPSLIKVNTNVGSGMSELDINLAFIQLVANPIKLSDIDKTLDYGNYTTRDLANDLIKYHYITGGNSGFNSFGRFIPNEYLKQNDFVNKINNFDFAELSDHIGNTYNDLDSFVIQYIQHNPNLVQQVDKNDLVSMSDKTVHKTKVIKLNKAKAAKYLVVRIPIEGEKPIECPPEFLSMYDSKSDSKYALFRLVDVGEYRYERIDTLGSYANKEYDKELKIGETHIKSNKSGRVREQSKAEQPTKKSELLINKLITEQYGLSKLNTQYDAKTILSKLATIVDPKSPEAFIINFYLKNISKFKIGIELKNKITRTLPDGTTVSSDRRGIAKLKNGFVKIEFSLDELNKVKDNPDFNRSTIELILHEIGHAMTMSAISTNPTSNEMKAIRNLRGIMNRYIDHLGRDKFESYKEFINEGREGELRQDQIDAFYAATDLREFVTMVMSNRTVQKELNKIEIEPGKTFWQAFIEKIIDLFEAIGFKINNHSALQYALDNIFSIVEGKDVNYTIEFNSDENTKEIITELNSTKVNDDIEQIKIDKNKTELESFAPPKAKIAASIPVIANKQAEVDLIRKEINKLSYNRTKENLGKIGEYEARINTIEKTIQDLQKAESIATIMKVAEEDLLSVDEAIDYIDRNNYFIAKNIVNLWKNSITELLNETEYNSEFLRKGNNNFRGIEFYENWASRLDLQLDKKRDEIFEDFAKQAGYNINVQADLAKANDLSTFSAYGLDLSHNQLEMLRVLDKTYKELMGEAEKEYIAISKNVDNLVRAAARELEANKLPGKTLFEIYKQFTKNGYETGNMLTPYSYEYYQKRYELWSNARNSSETKRKDNWKKYYQFKREQEIIFDFRKLFPDTNLYSEETFTELDKEKHIQELKDNLGEKVFNTLYNSLQAKYEMFKDAYEANKERIENMDTDNAMKALLFEQWNKSNSPYWLAKSLESNVDFNTVYKIGSQTISNNRAYNYTHSVPRRMINGKETEWYDKNFDKIQKSDNLYNLYEYMIETLDKLNSYLPTEHNKYLHPNSIPTLKKSVQEIFIESGFKQASTKLFDTFFEQMGDRAASDISFANIDPEDGDIKELRTKFINNNYEEIEAITNRLIIDFRYNNRRNPDPKEQQLIKEQAIDELAKRKSFDLPKILKTYAQNVVMYKHKVQIEDIMKITDSIIHNARETEFNRDGKPVKVYSTGKIKKKDEHESFKNTKVQWDYYFQYFYGTRHQQENVIDHKKKHYTKQDEEEIAKIDKSIEQVKELVNRGEITSQAGDQVIDELENRKNKLGYIYVDSQIGRQMLKFVQLKGMGWNIFSGITNVGFGVISNIIESSDGRFYNAKELRKAYNLTLNSVLKNNTFGAINTDTANKIRSIINNWDLIGEAANEIYKRTDLNTLNEKFKWLAPYEIQKTTEYLNQAPIMIATLLHNKIKDKNGVEHSLWEAFDTNGNWKTEQFGDRKNVENTRIKLAIKQAIKRAHGNYYESDPLKMNDKFITTALKQFRTWMLEGVNNRFGSERPDELLGYTTKGRYRTILHAFGKARETSGHSAINNLLFTLRQATRKLVGLNTKFDERFNEVDAANMRKNLTELYVYVVAMTLTLILKNLGTDDDEDRKRRNKYIINALINTSTRLQTDISFYISPMSAEALTQNALPVTSLITDTARWTVAAGKFIAGDDEIATGVYAGHSRLLRETSRLFPLTTQVRKVIATGIQQFDK